MPSVQRASSGLVLTFQAGLLGVVYTVLSTPAAHTSNSQTLAAIIWPAPAIAVAVLWQLPYRQWGIFLLAVFLAMLFVGDRDSLSLNADAAFALLNVFQVALYTFLGRRFVSDQNDIDSTAKLARYMFFLPLLGTALVAALGGMIGMLTKHTSWFDEWRVMMVGNGLAILVLLPALLTWFAINTPRANEPSNPTTQTALTVAVLTMALLGAAAIAPAFNAELLRILLSVVLVWAAIRGGIKAASLGVVVAAIAGIGITMSGLGPYSALQRQNGVWDLQLDLAGLALLTFFVAAAVHERQILSGRLERARRFETMGMLSGGIAHDFNNILGAVAGYAELATEREKNGQPLGGALNEVNAAVVRGKDLTEQILLAGRRGAKNRDIVDLCDTVCDSLSLVRPSLLPGVDVLVSVPAKPVCVSANAGQLVRAVMNLMRNASQATQNQISVTLTVIHHASHQLPAPAAFDRQADTVAGEWLDQDCAWLDVLDNGHGIPKQHIHQLFDPFFTSRSGLGSKGHGTGLGLAIVAGVASDHAGGVAVWSNEGTQTLFRFMLPLYTGVSENPPMPPDSPGRGDLAIIFSDAADQRTRAENMLAELGFEPTGYDPSVMTIPAVQTQLLDAQLLVWIEPENPDSNDRILFDNARQSSPHAALVVFKQSFINLGINLCQGTVNISGELTAASLGQAIKMMPEYGRIKVDLSKAQTV
ncbi:MAG: MASE1 domain-containing protein [Polaromonas sp.]